jgi:hypothetical protein
VLGVDDQVGFHCPAIQFGRWPPVQQVQDMRRETGLSGVGIDAFARGVKMVPVEQHRGQAGGKPNAYGCQIVVLGFRFEVAEHGAPGAQHVHWMAVLRNPFEHFAERGRQSAGLLQLRALGGELFFVRQLADGYKVEHLFIAGLCRQILNGIAAVVEAVGLLVGQANRGVIDDDAVQTARDG